MFLRSVPTSFHEEIPQIREVYCIEKVQETIKWIRIRLSAWKYLHHIYFLDLPKTVNISPQTSTFKGFLPCCKANWAKNVRSAKRQKINNSVKTGRYVGFRESKKKVWYFQISKYEKYFNYWIYIKVWDKSSKFSFGNPELHT